MKTMLLPVKLSDSEVLAKSKAAAEKSHVISSLTDAMKDQADDYKARIKEEKAVQARLLQEIGSGSEMRLVEVDVEFFPRSAKAEVTRKDTGEVVLERAMTDEEVKAHRQGQLFKIDGGDAPADVG